MLALLVSLFTIAAPARAYFALLDNAEILPEGHYKVTGDLQDLTDSGGVNVGLRADVGFQEEYGVRGLIGAGVTDFFMGGFFKWVPIPDVKGQPAIGINAGVVFATDDGERALTFRFEPLLAKKFETSVGQFTPYGSIPVGFRNRQGTDRKNAGNVTVQAIVGSQLQIKKWTNLQFLAEVGVDLNEAPSHVALAAVFYFDEENGPRLK